MPFSLSHHSDLRTHVMSLVNSSCCTAVLLLQRCQIMGLGHRSTSASASLDLGPSPAPEHAACARKFLSLSFPPSNCHVGWTGGVGGCKVCLTLAKTLVMDVLVLEPQNQTADPASALALALALALLLLHTVWAPTQRVGRWRAASPAPLATPAQQAQRVPWSACVWHSPAHQARSHRQELHLPRTAPACQAMEVGLWTAPARMHPVVAYVSWQAVGVQAPTRLSLCSAHGSVATSCALHATAHCAAVLGGW